MSIVTKFGDKGMTSICGGRRLPKDHSRLEVCGSLDELSSFLGFCKALNKTVLIKKLIESIQNDLIIIGSEIASESKNIGKLKKRIKETDIHRLEANIKSLEKKLPKRVNFCLPGKNAVSGTFDIARAVSRRAERRLVTAKRKKILKNNCILVYLNRLSDLLYLLARASKSR